jgi:hypothetical protein
LFSVDPSRLVVAHWQAQTQDRWSKRESRSFNLCSSSVLAEDDRAGKPNMGTEFWAEVYTKRSIERAAHILDLIDEKWPALESIQRP